MILLCADLTLWEVEAQAAWKEGVPVYMELDIHRFSDPMNIQYNTNTLCLLLRFYIEHIPLSFFYLYMGFLYKWKARVKGPLQPSLDGIVSCSVFQPSVLAFLSFRLSTETTASSRGVSFLAGRGEGSSSSRRVLCPS